jgi:hypothetical protein
MQYMPSSFSGGFQDVLAIVFLDGLFQYFFGLVARGGHDRVVIVQRYHRQDDVARQRVAGADEGLGTTGTFEAVQPDHGRTWLGLEGVGDLAGELRSETEASGSKAAELQETPAGDAVSAHHLIEGFVGGHDNSPLVRGCIRAVGLPADCYCSRPCTCHPMLAPTRQHSTPHHLRCTGASTSWLIRI